MIILSVETSCDETSVAVLDCDEKTKEINLLSNVVSSQVKIHAKWGGVIPNLAAREHVKNVIPVLDEALKKAKVKLKDIDLFATTKGPGLIPALLIGTNAAKTLSYFWKKPLIGVQHIEGHIYANFLASPKIEFPLLALVVSGGHTSLILMKNHLEYQTLGETQDDAVGEAFDKVAKLLDLSYPGGPIVSKKADEFEEMLEKVEDKSLKEKIKAIEFPRPMMDKKNYDFSFSGLKTSVLYFYQNLETEKMDEKTSKIYKSAICKEFQDAAVEVLTTKAKKAIQEFKPKTVALAGGVAANLTLRKTLEEKAKEIAKDESREIEYLVPPFEFCGDNAAMIGASAFYRFLDYEKNSPESIETELNENWKNLEANSSFKICR